MNLSKRSRISSAVTPTAGAAGTTAIEGTILDMANFEGVLVTVRMGAITTGAATSIKLQGGAAANLSDAVDLAGTAQTIADSDDDKTFYIDAYQIPYRYVRLYVARATQNAVVSSATYLQYAPRTLPTTHGTGVSGETHVSPASGTA